MHVTLAVQVRSVWPYLSRNLLLVVAHHHYAPQRYALVTERRRGDEQVRLRCEAVEDLVADDQQSGGLRIQASISGRFPEGRFLLSPASSRSLQVPVGEHVRREVLALSLSQQVGVLPEGRVRTSVGAFPK